MIRFRVFAAAAGALVLLAGPTASAELIECEMKFDLEGWSVIYKHAKGTGRITCSNGQEADVSIVSHGGGASLGTQKVVSGTGSFSGVEDISELYGGYAQTTVHAGAGSAGDVHAMMKGNVNLTLKGTGEGVSVGIAFGSFRIKPL